MKTTGTKSTSDGGDWIRCYRMTFRDYLETRGKEWPGAGTRAALDEGMAEMAVNLVTRTFRVVPVRGHVPFEGPLDMVRQWWRLSDKPLKAPQ